jgi:hypothetical protein
MGCCRDRRLGALAMLAVALPGCVTGHLLDAARRRERPLTITGATLDGDRVVVQYTAEITDDAGTRVGMTPAAAAIPLRVLRAPVSPRADELVPGSGTVNAVGTPVHVVRGAPADGPLCAGPLLEVVSEDGRDSALVWHDGPTGPPGAPVPTAGLTRMRTAPWAWALAPAGLAVDAVLVPVLVFFAPAVMVLGE